MGIINVSQSGPMQAEVAKQLNQTSKDATNQKVTPILEQAIQQNPYGADGMKLSKQDDYHALSTILPNAEAEKARKKLEKESKSKKKKKKKKKKENFWQWLFSK